MSEGAHLDSLESSKGGGGDLGGVGGRASSSSISRKKKKTIDHYQMDEAGRREAVGLLLGSFDFFDISDDWGLARVSFKVRLTISSSSTTMPIVS